MSSLTRIKNWLTGQRGRSDAAARSDAQSRLPGELYDTTTGKTDPHDWVSSLTRNKIRDHSNVEHRETMAELQPCAKLWTRDIATTIFDNWFRLVDADGKEREDMDIVQETFRKLRMEEVLKRSCVEERKHGWAIIYKVYSGARLRSDKERNLTHYMGDHHAFSDTPARGNGEQPLWLEPVPTKCLQMDRVDAWNNPEIIKYTSKLHAGHPTGGRAIQVNIHASRCYFIVPRPKDRHWEGYTALSDIWEILVAMNQHLDNMGWYAGKVGWYKEIWKKRGPTDDAWGTQLLNTQQSSGKRTFEVIDTNIFEGVELLAPPVSQAGLSEQMNILFELLSSGTGITTARWKGAQAGELEGSRTNLKLERAVVSSIQDSYEPILRAIIEDLFPGQFTDYYFDWEQSEQFDELEKAQLDSLKADIVTKAGTVLTRGELRESLGYDPEPEGPTLAEEQQEAIKELAQVGGGSQTRVGTSSGEEGQTVSKSPPQPTRADAWAAIENKRFPEWVAYWESQGYSQNAIIKTARIGRGTFYTKLSEQRRRLVKADIRL